MPELVLCSRRDRYFSTERQHWTGRRRRVPDDRVGIRTHLLGWEAMGRASRAIVHAARQCSAEPVRLSTHLGNYVWEPEAVLVEPPASVPPELSTPSGAFAWLRERVGREVLSESRSGRPPVSNTAVCRAPFPLRGIHAVVPSAIGAVEVRRSTSLPWHPSKDQVIVHSRKGRRTFWHDAARRYTTVAASVWIGIDEAAGAQEVAEMFAHLARLCQPGRAPDPF
jgi:hypothetical protein